MSKTPKVGEKWNLLFARPYILHRAQQLFVGNSLSEEHIKSAAARKLCACTRERHATSGAMSLDWLKSWKLTGIGEETGFSTCYLHAFSTCQRSPSSTPLRPSSSSSHQTFPFAHPHNYSYRLIIALPVLAPPLPP